MRLTTKVAAFGAGYVLGARAGRKRYGQIAAAAQYATKRLEKYGSGGSIAKSRARRDDAAGESRS